jgi:FAD:protein FMN transferase
MHISTPATRATHHREVHMSASTTRARWRALGTGVDLLVTDARALSDARALVERELDAIDRACSRFRPDSELTRLNACAGRVVHVGQLLSEAIALALRAAELTNGDVDPALCVVLELAGYDRDWGLLANLPSAVEDPRMGERLKSESASGAHPLHVRATVRAGWRKIELDSTQGTIRLPVGVKLDLGATAKAWAADRASRAVHDATGCGVLISLGGDISTAGSSPACGWQIRVTDDHRSGPTAPGQTISITGGGLATSSTTVRRWNRAGEAIHHIIDPSTGASVREVWRTASVAAADCVDANIAATAAIVRGTRAPEWLAEIGLPARLVGRDGEVLTVGSWPQDGE